MPKSVAIKAKRRPDVKSPALKQKAASAAAKVRAAKAAGKAKGQKRAPSPAICRCGI